MRNFIFTNFGVGFIGFVCGALTPILLVGLLKFSAIQVCKPGSLIAGIFNLKSGFTIYTSTEIVAIESVFLTILIYAIVASMSLIGFNFLFGLRVQNQ